MVAVGLTKDQYRRQLAQWLELAGNRNVPIALLIMSRALTLNTHLRTVDPTVEIAATERALAASISGLDADLVNEAVVEAANADAAQRDTLEQRERRLVSVDHQNRLIEEERKAIEDSSKALAEKLALIKTLKEKADLEAIELAHQAKASLNDQDEEEDRPSLADSPTRENAEDADARFLGVL